MGTVFAEKSSWTALAWYSVMKTAFKTKNMKSEYFWDLYHKDFNFLELLKYMYILEDTNNKELIKVGFSASIAC